MKKRIKVRKIWIINPRTKVVKSGKAYERQREKERTAGLYESEGFEA